MGHRQGAVEVLGMSLFSDCYRDRRVLITGHTGFKGAWLTRGLLDLGSDVTGYALAPDTSPSLFEQLGLAAHLRRLGRDNPILLKDCLGFGPEALMPEIALLRASVNLGALLADGIGDAILVRGESGAGQSLRLSFNILQAAGCRSFKTDYVACPSCGRTLFDLQTVTARIKSRTAHLKGVKIAIMGCIVNGPGVMADADFGYVGGAPNKINLYVGKKPVKFNIPEVEAVERLVDLIKEHGKWVDAEQAAA